MNRLALVTGGNRGIGHAIVKRLCKEFNGVVLFTARDEKAGVKVCGELSKELNVTNIKYYQLDITSQESIDKLRAHVMETFGGLDVLINNSGVLLKKSEFSYAERAETTIKINFFGTLNMCRSFFPLLRPHARVVNVSSLSGSLSCVSPPLQKQFSSPTLTEAEIVYLMEKYISDSKQGKVTENGWPDDASTFSPAYNVSKIGVTALSMVQVREFKHDTREGILVNAVCPGWVRTDMGGANASRSPEEGADTPIYCALLPKGTTSPNGEFVQSREICPWLSVRRILAHGHDGRKNDVVFCGSEAQQHVVFFPGDVQDYVENMETHAHNKKWKQWNLESTAKILEKRFPYSFIWVVRPSRYHQNTFACYQNFVEANIFGVPDHRNHDYGALYHLRALLESAVKQVLDIPEGEQDATFDFQVILVGFSKGCVVLNQIIYELSTVSTGVDPRLNDFASRISAMYWLDGGHGGESNTWVTDEKFLDHLAKHVPRIRVHMTPYQIKDATIGKEQKKFVENLRSLDANVKVKVHFQDRDPSLAFHFKLLESF